MGASVVVVGVGFGVGAAVVVVAGFGVGAAVVIGVEEVVVVAASVVVGVFPDVLPPAHAQHIDPTVKSASS